jgi:hypothetical protein
MYFGVGANISLAGFGVTAELGVLGEEAPSRGIFAS